MFGITGALYGEITLKDGRVEQSNFDNYQMLRIDEAPTIEVISSRATEDPAASVSRAHRLSRRPWRTRSSRRRANACANCQSTRPP